MPSCGYGAGDPTDREVIAMLIDELNADGWSGMLPDVLATYITARLAGESPDDSIAVAYVEWDL